MGQRFSKTERAVVTQKVLRLELLGNLNQYEIAEELQISQSYVSRVLKKVRTELAAHTTADAELLRKREVARLDLVAREFLEAWERSRAARETTQTEKSEREAGKSGKPKQRKRAMLRKEHRDGNPAFLMGYLNCIKERCELLGLYPPKKRELSGPDGGAIPLSIEDKRRNMVEKMLERLLEDGLSFDDAITGLRACGISEQELAHLPSHP